MADQQNEARKPVLSIFYVVASACLSERPESKVLS